MADSRQPRRFKVEPVETTVKKAPRRFAPEPVETTSRSVKKENLASAVAVTPRTKFLPEPIETTESTNRKNKDAPSSIAFKERNSASQLVEASLSQRGLNKRAPPEAELNHLAGYESMSSEPVITELPTRRKFQPVLLDTAKRTRRAGDAQPAHLPSDRTDAIPEHHHSIRRTRTVHLPAQPENTPADTGLSTIAALSSAECRRLGLPVLRRQTSDSSPRPHSFRAPTLEPIDSSESGEESDHSSNSSSHSTSSDMSYQMYQHATRLRESVDARSRGYLLELAAKAAEVQLREQADAAFPNSDRHVPVDHYIGHEDDDVKPYPSRSDQDPRRFGSVNWEQKDMQRHHEHMEASRQKDKAAKEARKRWNKQYEQNCGPWKDPFKNQVPHEKKNKEMERMRKQARPPMLGADIEFPRCPSPEPARFDVTQGTYSERTAMCYLTQESGPGPCGEGLWAHRMKKSLGPVPVQSPAESRAPSPAGGIGGLWGGFCKGQAGIPDIPRGPTGLLTPAILDENMTNPFESFETALNIQQLPPSPPQSSSGFPSLDEKLEVQQKVEDEFSDEFITQVYNYLSLGYPSIARGYDEELSKITRTPVSDLRQDDKLESSRGYIRFGEDGNSQEEGINEDMCSRWKALKAYIHEWARQQPGMQESENRHGFGVAVRRGSWAW